MIVGQSENGNSVELKLDRLIESRLLAQANSGAGKSWLLRRLLEQTYGKVQQLVIDVEDEFYTLREKFDYVLAGRHGGDCPADVRSATLLAKRLLELNTSAIIGIYELKAHDRIRFVRLFLESLVNAPRELWHPVLVIVDEAHIFAPQHGEAESLGAVIDLMTRGRKRGFCGVLATQRISKLHKDAAAEANNKLIGRSALDVDMKRAGDELGFTTRDQQNSLRVLRPGEFFAFGPAISDVVIKVKVGPVETTHPKSGQQIAAPRPPRDKVRAVLAQLADLPKEVEQEALTAADLRKRIAELERQAKTVSAPVSAKADPEALKKEFERGAYSARKSLASEVKKFEKSFISGVKDAIATSFLEFEAPKFPALEELIANTVSAEASAASVKRISAPMPVREFAAKMNAYVPPKNTGESNGSLGQSGLRRILIALAQRPQGLSARQIGSRAGLSSKSGSFGTYLSKGRSEGWIVGSRDLIAITDAGLEALGSYDPLPTGRALVDYWKSKLGGGMSSMLEALAESYPESLSDGELGEICSLSNKSGSFGTYLSKLRTLELITGTRSALRMSDELA